MANQNYRKKTDDVFNVAWCFILGVLFLLSVSGCSQWEPNPTARFGNSVQYLKTDATVSFNAVPLDKPFEGKETGVSAVDLNGDDILDLVFSAGRHEGGQSYAMYNPLEESKNVQKIGNSEYFSAVSVADVNGDGRPD